MGGRRDDVLRQRGRQAHHEAGRQQHADGRRHGGRQQGQAQHGGLDQDDALSVVAVAQRRPHQDAEGIAQLRQGGNPAQRFGAGVDVGAQHAQHGLAVIPGRNRQACADGKQQDQAARQGSGGSSR
ncbi:hypothetical protein G6F32_015476 [Rhizopus arrhizus]|nr:hypothetical protein G6F32_015476 [Rhizopus arrhizus]